MDPGLAAMVEGGEAGPPGGPLLVPGPLLLLLPLPLPLLLLPLLLLLQGLGMMLLLEPPPG